MDEYRDGVRSRPRMIFPTRVSGRSGGGRLGDRRVVDRRGTSIRPVGPVRGSPRRRIRSRSGRAPRRPGRAAGSPRSRSAPGPGIYPRVCPWRVGRLRFATAAPSAAATRPRYPRPPAAGSTGPVATAADRRASHSHTRRGSHPAAPGRGHSRRTGTRGPRPGRRPGPAPSRQGPAARRRARGYSSQWQKAVPLPRNTPVCNASTTWRSTSA
jgi:hypothetical protein